MQSEMTGGEAIRVRVPNGRAETVLRRALLAVALGLSCLLGYLTSYALLLLAAAGLVYLLARRQAVVFDLPAKLFAAVFLVILVTFAISANSPPDVLFAANFIAFLIYAPLATLLRRAANPRNAEKLAQFALAGAASGALVAALGSLLLGELRGGNGMGITDPIRLADTALILGFFAMIGVVANPTKARWYYLLGPVLGLVAVFATGSRGALVGFPVLVAVAAFMLLRRKRLALLVAGGIVAAVVLIVVVGDMLGARSSSLLDMLASLTQGDAVGDEGVRIRLLLYQAGLSAFADAPLFGHGWSGLMGSIVPYLAPSDLIHAKLPHLHNDALNFAVLSGVFGIGVYFALLALPPLCCLFTPRDSQYRARLYGCWLLSVGYFVLGLPDTMLSFELHTALYVALTAILLGYCRDTPGREQSWRDCQTP